MKIALAQIDTTVGAFARNAEKVRDFTRRAREQGAELVLFPELGLAGYPPKDFLKVPEFLDRARRAMDELCQPAEWNQGIAIYIGGLEQHPGTGAGLHNTGVLIVDGRRVATARKMLLPTYDVFDEARYFDPGGQPTLAEIGGVPVGLTVCEDLWNDEAFWGRRRYPRDPASELAQAGATLLLNVSASPYAQGKPRLREQMLAAAARRHGIPIAYLNLVGGNDSLVFDGHSALIDARGQVIARAGGFREELLVADLEHGGPVEPHASDLDELEQALVLGLRDYAAKSGFSGAVLGLSGGIDSCLVAYLAAKALGPEQVVGVAMPSRFTSDMSKEDAALLAKNLGIALHDVPIEPIFESFLRSLEPVFADLPHDVTEENIQARVRGTLLMALSNKQRKLLLTTGNKSELAVGYCTLYGDMAGGLAVIGDVPKTTVFALARNANKRGEVIPERAITRPPSAELRENQRDEDSLPPYPALDAILKAYIVGRKTPEEIAAMGFPEETVQRALRLVLMSEYKRRQAAPVLRVSARAFGEGWRFPIAHGFGF
ncbi:MAG: NAD+ synthase [Myxococcales bacterium]